MEPWVNFPYLSSTMGVIECLYRSSNILKSSSVPEDRRERFAIDVTAKSNRLFAFDHTPSKLCDSSLQLVNHSRVKVFEAKRFDIAPPLRDSDSSKRFVQTRSLKSREMPLKLKKRLELSSQREVRTAEKERLTAQKIRFV
jgi:hypothetical protein